MIDALGAPIKEGDLVLTNKYKSTIMCIITRVEKISKNGIHVFVSAHYYDSMNQKHVSELKLVKRRCHQILVIDKQLKHNRKTYPEYAI